MHHSLSSMAVSSRAQLIIRVWALVAYASCLGLAASPAAFIIDQSGQNAAEFPYADLVRWGVKQTVGGGLDCTTQLGAIPGGPWYNASELAYIVQQVASARAQIASAHAAGLKLYLASDMFQLPLSFLGAYSQNLTYPGSTCTGYSLGPTCIDIRSNFTQLTLRALFTEVVETLPGLDGVVLRYGENSPCRHHAGNCPFDASNPIPSLQALLAFLREELCVVRGLDVVFRTWDVSATRFHANPAFYLNVTDAIAPHPRLVFSIKHTALDFWRRVALNPTIGVGRHRQVIEAEISGMYAGCGSWPLYIGNAFINGYPENSPQVGLASLFVSKPDIVSGILMNHQCGSPATYPPFLWGRMEEAVLARWASDMNQSEEILWNEYAEVDLGMENASSRAALRGIVILGMAANLAIQTCAAFDGAVISQQMDRPTSNWMLWNAWGGLFQLDPTNHPSACHSAVLAHCMVFPYLGAHYAFPAAIIEKQVAAETYACINETAYSIVAPAMGSPELAASLIASTELGVFAARIVLQGWTVMSLGWLGDNSIPPGHYNLTGLAAAIYLYDELWKGYFELPQRHPGAVTNASLMTDLYWGEHPSSGQPGMRASVDRYRNVTALVAVVQEPRPSWYTCTDPFWYTNATSASARPPVVTFTASPANTGSATLSGTTVVSESASVVWLGSISVSGTANLQLISSRTVSPVVATASWSSVPIPTTATIISASVSPSLATTHDETSSLQTIMSVTIGCVVGSLVAVLGAFLCIALWQRRWRFAARGIFSETAPAASAAIEWYSGPVKRLR